MRHSKKEKVKIEVRNGSGVFLETILRKPWCEPIGNFNPMFCRYKRQICLVESEDGFIDDPFRRSEESLTTLFIRPRGADGKVVETWTQVLEQKKKVYDY